MLADGRNLHTGRLKRRIIASMAAVAAMLFHLRVRSQRAFKSVAVRSGRDGSKRHKQMVSVWIVKGSQPHERVWLLVSLHSWWAQKKVKWKLGWKKQREMQSRWSHSSQSKTWWWPTNLQAAYWHMELQTGWLWAWARSSVPDAESYDGNQHCVQKCLLHASHGRRETDNDRDTVASSKIVSLFIES